MNNINESLKILNAGIIQREILLRDVISAQKNYENLSDMGWFLTLGSEALGMLSAVDASK